jgi:protocatechuate 3,4-dioxygenase beta subunit
MLYHVFFAVLIFSLTVCCAGCKKNTSSLPASSQAGQAKTSSTVGGGCEGCELMYVGLPEKISSSHTSPGWTEGEHKLKITGKVLALDGKTPVSDVIVYYWHTNDDGLYTGNDVEHGKYRGWIRTESSGDYTILTSMPTPYPGEDMPAHIHLSIKEPAIVNEYYADLYFEGDPFYKKHVLKYGKANRAGEELVQTRMKDGVLHVHHDIILGKNIPDYPKGVRY